MVLVVGFFIPVNGQQQLCFSKNCPETSTQMFRFDRSIENLNHIFETSPALPGYQPVLPLALSPSTRQFFQHSAPTEDGSRLSLPAAGNSATVANSNHNVAMGLHAPVNLHDSNITAPKFSTGQGGVRFTPPTPRF
jgi:hypothetical protein